MTSRALLRPPAIAAVVLALALLAGCSGDPDDTDDTGSTDEPTASVTSEEPSPTETDSPSQTPSEQTTEPSPSTTASNPTLAQRLLTADELPGFNDEWTWRGTRTSDTEPQRPVGTCMKFPLTSAGATKVALRSYAPGTGLGKGPTAVQLVAEFADPETATRAYSVLTSWHDQCPDRLKKYNRVDVRQIEPVKVDAGKAGWYLALYAPVPGDPDASYFDAQGMVLVGNRITVLGMRLAGQDYNYEPGQEPMALAVAAAAKQLG